MAISALYEAMMDKKLVLEKIREAGVVGAGGAGFPTHIKLNCNAEVVIANGAECEPLLRTDRLLMESQPERIILGLKAAMAAAGAQKGVIVLKKKYEKAIAALQSAINAQNLTLHLMDSFYPAGDEQQIVYDVTSKVVPTGGLPLDAGTVVQNVSTLCSIADALQDVPVTKKLVTVTGEVKAPAVYEMPVGVSIGKLIAAAHGPSDMNGYRVIIGGPLMGRVTDDLSEPVQKTTGGIVVLRASHPLIQMKTRELSQDLKLARSVCCQCNFCTMLCPRNALGLKVEPHKIMRVVALGARELDAVNGVFSCCDCGICTYYACNFSLAPSKMMQIVKERLLKDGIKPEKHIAGNVSANIDNIKVPVSRLTKRLGIDKYDRELELADMPPDIHAVKLPLKMHIGEPAKSLVQTGDVVSAGQKIAVCEGLGAHVHASIAGRVNVCDTFIEIEG